MSAGRTRGFTLTEILAAVAILAVLAGIAVPVTARVVRAGRISATKQEMAGLARALRAYGEDYGHSPERALWGRFPPECAGAGAYGSVLGRELEEDVAGAGWDMAYRKGWNGPYVQGENEAADASGTGVAAVVRSYQVDAWGRYYLYRNEASGLTARTVTLTSGGPDRNLATAGDNLTVEVYRGPAW